MKTAIIIGASGLVGSALLERILSGVEYKVVKVFVRKSLNIQHPKLQEFIIDFDMLGEHRNDFSGHDLYLCLGTTIKIAKNKEQFYKVDHTYTIGVAGLCFRNNVRKVVLISSNGADVDSSIFYSKVKGEVERDLCKIGYNQVHIMRPSLLLGDRKNARLGEKIGEFMSKLLSFAFVGPLKKYKPIGAVDVARVMYLVAQDNIRAINENSYSNSNIHIYESDEIQMLANQ